jgi:predicted nucleic acid-binding protein
VPNLIATIDTSVLVSLQSAALLGAVSVLFNRLLVPAKVREELKKGGDRNRDVLRAIEDFAIFEHCNDYDTALVQLLLQTRSHLRKGKDEGEAEAVIQAAERPAKMVLTDDALGRAWARRYTRECHGTIWICYQLRHTGFLTELRPYYVRMLQCGRRQPLVGMNRYLLEFGETKISENQYDECISRSKSRNEPSQRQD